MTDREAQEIVSMVESTWKTDYGTAGRKMWRRMLYDYEPGLAVDAVALLSQRQRERPMIADLKSMIRHLIASRAPTPGIPQHTGNLDPPEWVWVWSWCRHIRAPRFMIPFPQQEPYIDASQAIPMERYDELREEWASDGSPKLDNPIPRAV